MSQRLVLPLNDLRVTAGYKNPQYLAYWKFAHYGMDCTSPSTTVYACGNGEVVACGQDGPDLTGANSRLGNVIVIVYKDVLCNDGKVRNLTCRMYHFAAIRVSVGQKVTKDTVIGYYGNTGANTTGAHLHIEFDADINYPTLAYGVSVKSINRIINTQAAVQNAGGLADSTINPSQVWFLDANQSIKGAANGWYVDGDITAPKMPQDMPTTPTEETVPKAEYDAVVAERDALAAKVVQAVKILG